MKALVTGAHGFIGGHAKIYFQSKLVDTLPSIADRDTEVIFSIASGSEVGQSLEHPRPFIRNNIDLIVDLLEFARTLPNLRHFIHISTSEVYGPCNMIDGFKEWSPIVTHSPYSASKAAQEAILMAYWKSFGVPVTIVNTMNVFGELQQKYKFLPMLVRQILCNKKILIHGALENPTIRRHLHADVLADALLFIADHDYRPEKNRPQRFNVAGEKEMGMLTFIDKVARMLGHPFTYEFIPPTRPGHGDCYSLNSYKISTMGWKPPMGFEESLTRTVAHWASVFGKVSAGASISRGATQVEPASGSSTTPAPPSIIPG